MKAVVYSNLTLNYKKHPLQFVGGVRFVGQIKNNKIEDIDLNLLRKSLESFCFSLRGRSVSFFENYKGMEIIAISFLKNFYLIKKRSLLLRLLKIIQKRLLFLKKKYNVCEVFYR